MALSVSKAGKVWRYRFVAYEMDGKRKWESKSGFKTKKEAETAGYRAMLEFKKFVTSSCSMITFEEYSKQYMDTRGTLHLAVGTQKTYKTILKLYILPVIGDIPISLVTTKMLDEILFSMRHLSRGYCQFAKGVIDSIFSHAHKVDRVINFNPADALSSPAKRNGKTKPLEVLALEDVKRILNWAKAYDINYYTVLLLGFELGLRISEATGLDWKDVDLENGKVTIRQALKYKTSHSEDLLSYYLGSLKTENGYRTILMSKRLVSHLSAIRANPCPGIYFEKIETILPTGEKIWELKKTDRITRDVFDPVIRSPRGYVFAATSISTFNLMVDKELGYKNFHYHLLRHTHATLLVDSGAPIKEVSKRLGHKSITTTMDLYVKRTDDMQNETLKIFEKKTKNLIDF